MLIMKCVDCKRRYKNYVVHHQKTTKLRCEDCDRKRRNKMAVEYNRRKAGK